MCGIAGWLGFQPDGETVASRMSQALAHRGPDAQGIRSWPEAKLIHTRLSIIDLSPAGAQPMSNEDGTVWTVFNGEIYNYRALRNELVNRGHVFKSKSDTEVLNHLYEEEGPSLVNKLRGMFAFAVYDTRKRKLFLARDRFGIKPLFYAMGKDWLAFASEINALLELPQLDDRPDRQAIHDFAALFYIPAPETFYAGIRALLPGETLEAQFNYNRISWQTRTSHTWTIAPDFALTLDEAVDRTDELVANAVRQQLESDVPLGALLSGGIDSSLVSYAAQEALNGGLRTFNVQFPSREYDETSAALMVAEKIHAHHEILQMKTAEGTWNGITNLLSHAGQPFADTSIFAVSAVCRLMRQRVTVALSGDGGDEGFGGYSLYWRLARIARLQKLPLSVWRGAALLCDALKSGDLIGMQIPSRLNALAGADDTTIVQHMFCQIPTEEHSKLCLGKDLLPLRRLFEPQWTYILNAGASRLERLSAHATEVNTRLELPNDFLFKVDTASMKEGLEVRVPMLDEDLFNFALTLPYRLKVKGRTCKIVLRELARRKLPRSVADKPKRGFAVPLDVWFHKDFKQCVREALLGTSSVLAEFFRPEAYRPIVAAFCSGTTVAGLSRKAVDRTTVMLLSIQLGLQRLDFNG